MALDPASSTDPATGWLRAALDLAVLAVLTDGEGHGYALIQRLAQHRLGPVRGGALYPVLARLETEGAVTAQWRAGEGGPGRKVYALTGTGRDRLADGRDRWHDFSTTFDRLLTSTDRPTTTEETR